MESEFLSKIEQFLEECVQEAPSLPQKTLFEAARYALFPGGKRLRPLLTVATAVDLGGTLESALMPACALELVHTYSLIHDDLPCMDDDLMRRDKPVLHLAFNEGIAVLAGDYLLTRAFELVSHAPDLSVEVRLELVQKLTHFAGSEGMIGGQVVDIASGAQREWIDAKKTGALFSCALEFGGIVAGASHEELAQLSAIGHHFGLGFQNRDDINDGDAVEEKGHFERALVLLDALKMPSLTAMVEEFETSYV